LPRKFDYYLFVRPDLEYLDDFPLLEIISAFKGQKNIALPEWHSWGGVNDRFAFADPAAAEIYSDRIEHVLEYCTTTPLHPEVFLKHTLQREACNFWSLPVRALRVRATGERVEEDFALALAKHQNILQNL
jgi:hypothetical protein